MGLIAALTLPSIFNGVATQRKKAVLKESYNAFSTALHLGVMNGEINSAWDMIAVLDKNLNYTKRCTNANFSQCSAFVGDGSRTHAYLLANGGSIILWGNANTRGSSAVSIVADNRAGAPMTIDNHIHMGYAWTDETFTNPSMWCKCREGEVMYSFNASGADKDVYAALWK